MRIRWLGAVLWMAMGLVIAVESEALAVVRRLLRRPACPVEDCRTKNGGGKDSLAATPPAGTTDAASPDAVPEVDIPLPPLEDRGSLLDLKKLFPALP
jgi:hypothetical protein